MTECRLSVSERIQLRVSERIQLRASKRTLILLTHTLHRPPLYTTSSHVHYIITRALHRQTYSGR